MVFLHFLYGASCICFYIEKRNCAIIFFLYYNHKCLHPSLALACSYTLSVKSVRRRCSAGKIIYIIALRLYAPFQSSFTICAAPYSDERAVILIFDLFKQNISITVKHVADVPRYTTCSNYSLSFGRRKKKTNKIKVDLAEAKEKCEKWKAVNVVPSVERVTVKRKITLLNVSFFFNVEKVICYKFAS